MTSLTLKLVPSPAEIDALRAEMPEGPIVTVALLRFKKGAAPRAAYERYMTMASTLSDFSRVDVLHVGRVWADVLTGQTWDYVIVARYAALEDFARVVLHPRYQTEAAVFRDQALDGGTTLVSQACDFGELCAAPDCASLSEQHS